MLSQSVFILIKFENLIKFADMQFNVIPHSIVWFDMALLNILIHYMFSARRKNTNFTNPKKLSPVLMNIFGTDQKYQKPNDIRSLLRQYITRKKLQVCIFGRNSFKYVSIANLGGVSSLVPNLKFHMVRVT